MARLHIGKYFISKKINFIKDTNDELTLLEYKRTFLIIEKKSKLVTYNKTVLNSSFIYLYNVII